MAICVMGVVGAAPCQCFSPGANQTTSPGRISSTGPPQRCARPHPAVTTSVCPSGCVCHAVRAPGSKVTLAPCTRAGSGAANSGSMRTVPVNQSAGPLPEGCVPARLISIGWTPYSLFISLQYCATWPLFRFERSHVDREAVLHVRLHQPLISFVDLLNRNDFDVGDNVVLRAEVEHLLSFRD